MVKFILNSKEIKNIIKGMKEAEMCELLQFLIDEIEELKKRVVNLEKLIMK